MNQNQNSPPIPLSYNNLPLESIKMFLNEAKKQLNPLEDYISKEEFLEKFGIKTGLYYKLLNRGCLRIYYVGSKSFLRISELDYAIKNDLLK